MNEGMNTIYGLVLFVSKLICEFVCLFEVKSSFFTK